MKKEIILLHYLIAALWSSTDESSTDDTPLDSNYEISDFDHATHERMKFDVEKFVDENIDLLKESGLSDEQIGHDFWLTRNRHGAGFWDRGLGKIGDNLTEASGKFKEFTLYVGDDNKIYRV